MDTTLNSVQVAANGLARVDSVSINSPFVFQTTEYQLHVVR